MSKVLEVVSEERKKQREELKAKFSEYQEYLTNIQELQIGDEEEYTFAVELRREVREIQSNIESQMKEATDPLTSVINTIRSWFKPARDVLSEADSILKSKIETFVIEQKQKKERAIAITAAAARMGDHDAAHLAAKDIVEVPKADGTQNRFSWDFAIEDLDKVPREWLCLDQSKVKIYIKQFGKEMPKSVPGLRFFERVSVATAKR